MHLGQNVINFTEKLRLVRQRVAEAAARNRRDPTRIGLVAVSKRHGPRAVRAVFDAGQRDFGENQLQEALTKIESFNHEEIRWHFIGPLQSNKTRKVAEFFHWVHTVDRYKIAKRLNEHRPHYADPLQVCLQVNIASDAQKSGIPPEEAPALAQQVSELPRLALRGLMCIPPMETLYEKQCSHFARLRGCLEQLNERGLDLDVLSMGMSADLEAAVAEGSTMLRIGTAIFGPREKEVSV